MDLYLTIHHQATEPPPEPTVSIATPPAPTLLASLSLRSLGECIDCCCADVLWQQEQRRGVDEEDEETLLHRRRSPSSFDGRAISASCHCRYFRMFCMTSLPVRTSLMAEAEVGGAPAVGWSSMSAVHPPPPISPSSTTTFYSSSTLLRPPPFTAPVRISCFSFSNSSSVTTLISISASSFSTGRFIHFSTPWLISLFSPSSELPLLLHILVICHLFILLFIHTLLLFILSFL